ncbi:MAG: DNA gyrase inhibitor YacG [Gammaproteobacteria bacterium]
MSRLIGVCPQCGQQSSLDETQNCWRPFCSERCRLLDLGAWFDESHRIADKSSTEEIDETDWPTNPDQSTRH